MTGTSIILILILHQKPLYLPPFSLYPGHYIICCDVLCTTNRYFLETEYRLFPPVTIFLDLFPRAGYFFNAFD